MDALFCHFLSLSFVMSFLSEILIYVLAVDRFYIIVSLIAFIIKYTS